MRVFLNGYLIKQVNLFLNGFFIKFFNFIDIDEEESGVKVFSMVYNLIGYFLKNIFNVLKNF